MAKPKFTLTANLVNVEPESNNEVLVQNSSSTSIEPLQKRVIKYERLSLNIRKDLKKDFQLWCIKKVFNMTQALEAAIIKMMSNS